MMVRLGSAVLLSRLGCDAPPLSPDAEALVGRWRAPTETLAPKGSLERLFVVTAEGRSETRTISRGLYAGQEADALSGGTAPHHLGTSVAGRSRSGHLTRDDTGSEKFEMRDERHRRVAAHHAD